MGKEGPLTDYGEARLGHDNERKRASEGHSLAGECREELRERKKVRERGNSPSGEHRGRENSEQQKNVSE